MADAVEGGADEVLRIGKRCYIGNLAWKTSWQDLKDKFRECGTVVYANVMRDEEGRSKGWGIVEFETPDEAVAAVSSLNGSELGGRKIMVREDREDRDVKQFNKENGHKPSSRGGFGGRGRGRGRGAPPAVEGAEEPAAESSGLQIVVQGIPWKYTWKDLKALFEEFPVDRADVVKGSDGRSRGYGTVRFTEPEYATQAIEKYHGTQLEGRTLTVFLDKYG